MKTLIMPKMAVLAPMPRASAAIAASAKPGLLSIDRMAYRRSCITVPITISETWSCQVGPGRRARQDPRRVGNERRRRAPARSRNRFEGISFVPQGHDRIDLHRPARGEPAREERGDGEDETRQRERGRVGGADPEEKAGEDPGEAQRAEEAEADPGGGESEPLA